VRRGIYGRQGSRPMWWPAMARARPTSSGDPARYAIDRSTPDHPSQYQTGHFQPELAQGRSFIAEAGTRCSESGSLRIRLDPQLATSTLGRARAGGHSA